MMSGLFVDANNPLTPIFARNEAMIKIMSSPDRDVRGNKAGRLQKVLRLPRVSKKQHGWV